MKNNGATTESRPYQEKISPGTFFSPIILIVNDLLVLPFIPQNQP